MNPLSVYIAAMIARCSGLAFALVVAGEVVACDKTEPPAKADSAVAAAPEPRLQADAVRERVRADVGLLSVTTDGEWDCAVRFGKQQLGVSPVNQHEVAPGRRVVDVQCPTGKGYSQILDIAAGEDAKVVVAPGMWTQLADRPTVTVDTTNKVRASIVIDGVDDSEATPAVLHYLRPGRHTLVVMADGYQQQEHTVLVAARQATAVHLTLHAAGMKVGQVNTLHHP